MTTKTSDYLAAIACVTAGVLIAALPHIIAWTRTGRTDWVASHDERYYLAIGSQAYFNHPGALADPVFASGGPSHYRPLPLLPGIWSAKVLGLDALAVGLMWRVLAGSSVGFSWYALFRLVVPRPWIAASLTLISLGDSGLIRGFPLIRLADRAWRIIRQPSDSLFRSHSWMHPEWRSVNPATTMPYLIAVMWAVLRARQAPTRGRIIVAGLAVGLLFHVYFYYWTAAALALGLALILDAGHRRVYLYSGCIGAAIGLPVVVADSLLMRGRPTDWLLRNDRFLSIGRFVDLQLPPTILIATALGLAWVLLRRRDLIFAWTLAAAGAILANQHGFTNIFMGDEHWLYVWGPALEFLLLLAGVEAFGNRLGRWRRAGLALGTVAIAAYGVGLWIRHAESTRCANAVANDRIIATYRAERPPGRSGVFAANAIVAGELDFVAFAAILENLRPLAGWCAYNSASVTDAELNDRDALDGVLRGDDRLTFESQTKAYGRGFPHPGRREDPEVFTARIRAYDLVRADLDAALARHPVRYVGLRSGCRPEYLDRGWSLVLEGPTWDVWERTPSQGANSP